jgi:hypothetical protein
MLIPNLAVKDLDRSVAFFAGLGFAFDQRFTDETATAMIVNEHATVMLLTESTFAEFTTRELADPATHTEAIIALSAESRDEVDTFADTALELGGSRAKEPMDLGFMYGRSFNDPDGHHWEIFWMDPAALEQSPDSSAGAAASARWPRRCYPSSESGRPKRGKSLSTSRKNVSSRISPSSISMTCSAQAS